MATISKVERDTATVLKIKQEVTIYPKKIK